MNDLRQLHHFVALAEHGHFARAAEAIHLSQPALSRSIEALETSLDCQLVDRHSRGISFTTHVQLVLEHAQRLLAGSRALKNAVSQLGNLQTGDLRLGAGPYPAALGAAGGWAHGACVILGCASTCTLATGWNYANAC